MNKFYLRSGLQQEAQWAASLRISARLRCPSRPFRWLHNATKCLGFKFTSTQRVRRSSPLGRVRLLAAEGPLNEGIGNAYTFVALNLAGVRYNVIPNFCVVSNTTCALEPSVGCSGSDKLFR